MSEKLTITNSNGDSVVLSHRPPFLLSKIDGLGDVDAEVQMSSAPFQDGSTHIDTLLEPRFVEMQVSILSDSRGGVSAMREQLARVFNPKLSLLILFENDRVARQIKAVSEHVPKFPSDNRGSRFQIALVNLVCPTPYWQEVNPTNVKLEDFVSNFRFPFSFPVSFAARGDMRTLINTGHVPAPVKIIFRGESINPRITNLRTGEFIRVKRTIPEGYSLVITTGFDNKAVRIVAPDGVETSAMGYIDLSSTFFSLLVGENQLTFATDGGKPEVYIEFRNLYLSV